MIKKIKKLLLIIFIIIHTLRTSGQIYIDLKQLKDAGIDIYQYPPQDLLNLGIGNCDLSIIKSAISKGARVLINADGEGGQNGETPLMLTKSRLNLIQSEAGSYWRNVTFYNDLVSSLK